MQGKEDSEGWKERTPGWERDVAAVSGGYGEGGGGGE